MSIVTGELAEPKQAEWVSRAKTSRKNQQNCPSYHESGWYFPWLLLPKSIFAEALGYMRNHWDALQVFLNAGSMPIDNNQVEQLMKQVAIGRKNWLFVGSVEAGERAATLLTIISTALRNDLDIWAYLKDVLDKLLQGSTDYESMRADVWKQSHPEAIRQYRADERRDQADRQSYRRANRRLSDPAGDK